MTFFSAEAKILEPLKLDKTSSVLSLENTSEILDGGEARDQKCLLCDEQFSLKHLFEVHRLVIADVHSIADLSRYVRYWRHRFTDSALEEFCTTMLLDKKPDGTPSKDEKYYLLSDVITEDKTLRFELQQDRLEKVLEQHRKERADTNFERECWFCHLQYKGARYGFLKHLSESHNLQLGAPEKLVFTTALLNLIEDKLNNFQCVYCEKVFKDRGVLKEHMRKKIHKRINPDDTSYDKYYMVNYLEMGKTWHTKQKKVNRSSNQRQSTLGGGRGGRRTWLNGGDESDENDSGGDDNGDDWSEWDEQFVSNIHCLFCDVTDVDFERLLAHMVERHQFNFSAITSAFKFYDKIRLVNYVRRQIHLHNCIFCAVNIDTRENLQKHMTASKHYQLPPRSVWNQVEYLFPTYEDDAFLCYLDDTADGDEAAEQPLQIDENVVV